MASTPVSWLTLSIGYVGRSTRVWNSGKIAFSSRRASNEDQGDDGGGMDEAFEVSPSLDLMSDFSNIDAVAVDDRCLN